MNESEWTYIFSSETSDGVSQHERAILTLESTFVTIGVMLLKEVIVDNNDAFDDELANLLHAARSSLEELKIHPSLSLFGHLCAHMLMK